MSLKNMKLDDPVTFAGWVFKEGSLVRSWKKRFLVCKRAEMAYYKNTDKENHAQLLGALTAAHIERLPDITNGLLIHGTEGRQLKIFTDTKAECDRCYAAIRKYCTVQNDGRGDADQRKGWLEKEGQHFRTWKKRYFVLSGRELRYSATIGAESLGGGCITGAKRDATRPFTLAVTFEGGREMRVGGKSEMDIDDWHKALRRGLLEDERQGKRPKAQRAIDDDPRHARDKEFAKRQASAGSERAMNASVTEDEASSLFDSASAGIEAAKAALQEMPDTGGDARGDGKLKANNSPPESYAPSSFRRHIVVETMPDNTASFIEVAEERGSEDYGEKPFSPTAPGITTIRRMRLTEKLLQEELEEERREAMMKENTVLMRPFSKSDAPDVKSCCCAVM